MTSAVPFRPVVLPGFRGGAGGAAADVPGCQGSCDAATAVASIGAPLRNPGVDLCQSLCGSFSWDPAARPAGAFAGRPKAGRGPIGARRLAGSGVVVAPIYERIDRW